MQSSESTRQFRSGCVCHCLSVSFFFFFSFLCLIAFPRCCFCFLYLRDVTISFICLCDLRIFFTAAAGDRTTDRPLVALAKQPRGPCNLRPSRETSLDRSHSRAHRLRSPSLPSPKKATSMQSLASPLTLTWSLEMLRISTEL